MNSGVFYRLGIAWCVCLGLIASVCNAQTSVGVDKAANPGGVQAGRLDLLSRLDSLDLSGAALERHLRSADDPPLTFFGDEGETRYVLYRQGETANTTLTFTFDGMPAWLSAAAYEVGFAQVKDKHGKVSPKADIVYPQPATQFTCAQARCVYLLRFTHTQSLSRETQASFALQVNLGEKESTLALSARRTLNRYIAKPFDLMIQAGYGGSRLVGRDIESIGGVAQLLSHFGVNTIGITPGIALGPDDYETLFTNTDISRARIIFPLAKKSMRAADNPDVAMRDLLKQVDSEVDRYQTLIDKYGDRLHIKLWDEPTKQDWPWVKHIYEAVNGKDYGLLTEISGTKKNAEYQQADINVLRLKDVAPGRFPPPRRADHGQDQSNKETLLYANTMHSLLRPYHTMRNIGWAIWNTRLDGYHFWGVMQWRQNPLVDGVDRHSIWGRGAILYPSGQPNTVWASVRMFDFLDGLEDHALLSRLEQQGTAKNQDYVRALRERHPHRKGRKRYRIDPESIRVGLWRQLGR